MTPPAEFPSFNFTVPGEPFGKPRMTQRDVWKKRPCVVQYREYCDRIRAAAPAAVTKADCFAIEVIAHMAVKPSWSKKKQLAALSRGHRAKPDADNILKSVNDAIFEQDCKLFDVRSQKFWCANPSEERTQVIIWYYP